MKTFSVIKIARGEYQVIDENGFEQFSFPTSKHEAHQFIIEDKAEQKFLNNVGMQKVAKKYINDNKLPLSAHGDLSQFMLNSIYRMYHGDIRNLMRSQSNYRDHLYELAERNAQARKNSLTEED